ncbi:pyridoxal-phosphate dependent enzyme [Caldiplasma sukawensis]
MNNFNFFCRNCSQNASPFDVKCKRCGSPIYINFDFDFNQDLIQNFPYIEKFLKNPINNNDIEKEENFMAKIEYLWDTLSYKDRGMNNLFSYLKSSEKDNMINDLAEDSSGNAGASFSFYSRIAGKTAHVFASTNANKNKLRQIEQYGGKIHLVQGGREEVKNAAINSPYYYFGHQYMALFYDAFRMISYEIFLDLDRIPDNIVIPFSTGTLLLGIYEGFMHLKKSGKIKNMPKLWAVSPEKAAGFIWKLRGESHSPEKSIADALTGIIPLRFEELSKIIKNYGEGVTVSDDEIIKAREEMLSIGYDIEYSSAVTFAAMKKYKIENPLLILTGHGIKNE